MELSQAYFDRRFDQLESDLKKLARLITIKNDVQRVEAQLTNFKELMEAVK